MTLLSLKSFNEGLFVADPYKLKMNLKLLYDVKIIPNPYKSLRYEIYNMGQDIGLKVGPRCFILSADERFKVVLEDEFNEREFTVVKATGNILFEKAVQIMRESSGDSTISASNRLVLELNSISWISYIYMLIWNCLCVLSPNFSSSGMLQSEKMSNDPRFLDYFNEKCDILCQCGVIPDRQKRILYEITYNIAEERRHVFIVICGENHSFVLELSNQKFENKFHNCPSIRYIPKTEILKQDQDSDSIERSANDFIELAIKTVAEMDKYDVLKNNCQNFVKNFLHELESSINPPLEGEVVIPRLISLITAICLYRMIWYFDALIYKEKPFDWWSFIEPVAALLLLYKRKSSPKLIVSICILILLLTQQHDAFSYIFTMIPLFMTFRMHRLSPFHILLLFFILSLLIACGAYFFSSEPILSSIALVLFTLSVGGWSALGRSYHQDLVISLPCSIFLSIHYILIYLTPWLHSWDDLFGQFFTFILIIILYCIQIMLIPSRNFEIFSLLLILILSLLIACGAYFFSSEPIVSSIALVLCTVSLGAWSALGRSYDQDLVISSSYLVFLSIFHLLILLTPWLHSWEELFIQFCTFISIIILYCIQIILIPGRNFEFFSLQSQLFSLLIISILVFYYSLSWEYLPILLFLIFWKRESEYKSILGGLLLLATPFIGQFCFQNLGKIIIIEFLEILSWLNLFFFLLLKYYPSFFLDSYKIN